MEPGETKKQYILQSVDNALAIIDLLFAEKRLSSTEIAARLHVGRTTAFRLLATLENRGLVAKDPSGKYVLCLKFFSIGMVVHNRVDLIQIVHPFLKELTRQTGEASHLVKLLDDTHVIFLDKVRAAGAVSLDTSIGYAKEIYRTATGKIILAFSPAEIVARYLETQPFQSIANRTDYTIQSEEEFLSALQRARACGYAVNDREDSSWISSYAVPLVDAQGNAVAAISIAGPSDRLADAQDKYIQILKDIAGGINRQLV